MMNNCTEGDLLPQGQDQFEYEDNLQPYPPVLSIGDNFDLAQYTPQGVLLVEKEPQFDPQSVIPGVLQFDGTDAHVPYPLLRFEASDTTKARPEFYTDDPNLVTLITNAKTLLYSQQKEKYFAQRGGQFEMRINHGFLNREEFIRLFVNHTSDRLITAVVQNCQKKDHLAFQKPNIPFILTIEEEQPRGPKTPKVEYFKDPCTQKLSAKVYPVAGTKVTSLKVRFNCVNGCMDRKQDKQWKLLVTKESGYNENLRVISRASIDIKAAEKPASELQREEEMKVKKDQNLPGRGRKRKAETDTGAKEQKILTLMFDNTANMEGNQTLESVSVESTSSFQSPPVVEFEQSGELDYSMMANAEQNTTYYIVNDAGIIQNLITQTNSLEEVSPEPSCSYAPIVDSSTPRDVLENKFVDLKTHLSREELIDFINNKTKR